MVNFNPYFRSSNIENLLISYENLLMRTGFINIAKGKLLTLNKSDKKISKDLLKEAEKDPPIRDISKKCPEDKELNPKTKRCINKCKPGFERNDDFKCIKSKKVKTAKSVKIAKSVKTKKLKTKIMLIDESRKSLSKKCPEGKELNPKTKRCNNKCKPGFERNDDFKCIKI